MWLAIGGGSWMVVQGSLTLGQLTSFMMYLGLMIWPMLALAWMFNIVERGSAAYSRIRAMLAEVGLVGKAPGRYNLHLGGNRIGTRIPRMYKENITEPEILASLDELIGRWAKEREAGEGFGDFTVRAGIIRPVLDPARDLWD